ncbi:GATA zinc finger domain-containing protein 1-like [Rhopilema esculentum]|uniref:GATA zinc finger domain-containing protein 1-like n=1 Tax=Rhopilema esculentum TaxID=499914 RepID=UPI0031DA548A|eukprot:gene14729-5833_t
MPQCADCFVDTCQMWRKTTRGLTVCNVCHLKRVQAEQTASVAARLKEKGKETIRQSSRKSKPSSKAAKLVNGKILDRATKVPGLKNRKALLKKKPSKSPVVTSAVVTASSIYHKGLLFKEGDVVSVTDISGKRYFAQIRGLLQDVFLNKSAVLSWLLPTVPNPTRFDPAIFLPGPDEDTPRPMECLEFVSRAPTNSFRLRTSYPPYQRTKPDLNSLLSVAEGLLDPANTELPGDVNTIDEPN